MAKDGKGKKTKNGNAKVPKEIGGVKVPKQLRKLGNKAVKAVKDPVVSEVVAGALLAAAAALREGKDPKTTMSAAFKGGVKGAGKGAKHEGARLSDGLKLLALDLARRTLDNMGEKRAQAADDQPPEEAPVPSVGEVRAAPAPKGAPGKSAQGEADSQDSLANGRKNG